jgi:hypothetical protein
MKKKKLYTSLLTVLMCSIGIIHLHAQSNFWQSKDAYLGQTPPNDTPKIFASELLVGDSGITMDRSAFSKDGKEFYYCHAFHWFTTKGATVNYLKYENRKWNGPLILDSNLYAPTFSMDNKTMYFLGGGEGVVMQSHRTNTGWTIPGVFIKRNYGMYDFMPTNSGNIYVASNINGSINDYSSYDICLLPVSEKDTMAQTLGEPLNTPGFDGDFFVAPDESYIIISAKETKNYKCEIDISFHKKNGSWTEPVSLGPLINTGVADRWGEYVTPDGKYLFYSKGTSEKDCAIYWVRFDKLLEKMKMEALNY